MKAFWVILLLLVAGFTGFWFVQAEKLERACKEELAKIDYATISYDSIQKRGFPLTLALLFTNPKVKTEAVSYALEGTLTARWSLFGTFKDIDVMGRSGFELPVSEEDKVSLYHLEGNTVAEVDSFTKGMLSITNARLHSAENDKVGPFDWTFDRISARYDLEAPREDRAIYDFDVEVKGAKYQVPEPAQEITLNDFYNVFMSTMAQKGGSTDYVLTFVCDLPSKSKIEEIKDSPLKLFRESFPTVSIALKSLVAKNALVSNEAKGEVSIQEDGQKNVIVHVDAKGVMRYFAGYYDALLESVDKMSNLAARWEAPKDLEGVKDLFVNHKEALKSIIPRPDSLGKIKLDESMCVVLNKRNLSWHFTLQNFDLSCDQYAMSAKANAQERNNHTRFDVTIKLKNAPGLVEDLQNLYNRLEGVVNLFEEQTEAHLKPLPEDAKARILDFIKSLSTESGDELEIVVSYHDGRVYVGPLTLEDARGAFEALWRSIMQSPAGESVKRQENTF